LFENVYGSPSKNREPEDVKDNTELRGHQPLNNITVSKKRNWLYQSTLRSQSLEESKRRQDRSNFSLDHGLSQPFCKSPQEQCTHTVCNAASLPLSGNCSLDLSEDNDADDEGEIWYNPIPEEDELGVASSLSLEEAKAATATLPALSVNMLSARDLRKAEPHGEELLYPAQHTGDVQTTQSNGINSVDFIHSAEVIQQCKQRLAHRTQEGTVAEASPMLKSAFT
ncbi:rho GTPase-activating protein SYDE2, partial [Sigmodon hispidus]